MKNPSKSKGADSKQAPETVIVETVETVPGPPETVTINGKEYAVWQVRDGAVILNAKGKPVADQDSDLTIPPDAPISAVSNIPGTYKAVVTGFRSKGTFKQVLVQVPSEKATLADLRAWYVKYPGTQETKKALSPDDKIRLSAIRQAGTDYVNDTRDDLANEVNLEVTKLTKAAKEKANTNPDFAAAMADLLAKFSK